MNGSKVTSTIKDEQLIERRRNQMIKGAVTLFKEKGFHRTTTREIAKASGFSIGTLYEYIRTKEDVLFLVCDSIYEKVKARMEAAFSNENASLDHLVQAVRAYYLLMDEMQDEVVIMYQEMKSLSKEAQEYVMQKEKAMVTMLEQLLEDSIPHRLKQRDISLIANNIFIQGQMWGFRRWMLQKEFTIASYTERQVAFLLAGLGLGDGLRAAGC
ncbi:TetR/AcrR family transcriptional regulator [Sediminibacillus halophilus]|uniref:DNA-binding transcriptional regulator, AcrR family n=1 Tax=Sediminibacillus halophilus TaxID=482461 RepID=A0A1G9TXK7_9BACI|nr:TetR/AcrR family transcriptional regulator [Sediminibacillus halophilus]SDM52338.1 DNA-binding transcriptional regulator, AcrR family [Sediminibacillus halophilus]